MRILAVNTGSASVKLALFEIEAGGEPKRLVDYSATADEDPHIALGTLLSDFPHEPDAIVHRVVHGGREGIEPVLITDAVEARIAQLGELAPLHNPRASHWIGVCRSYFLPTVRQVAMFDTAFFAALPEQAAHYAIPWAIAERLSIRRYGFHGIAHGAMWEQWVQRGGDAVNGKVISLQLGGGCSAAAIRGGVPLDTSMGFSPLEGLVMATRSGDVDPGALIHIARQDGLSPDDIDQLLNTASGLLGLSGSSARVEQLVDDPSERAQLALAVYCHRIRHYLGAYLAVLAGADAILFGGGVGEHSAEIRARSLENMDWCGIHLDEAVNSATVGYEGRISAPESTTAVWVMRVDESLFMVRAAARLLAA